MSANLANNALRALARTAARSAPSARASLRAFAPTPSPAVVLPSFASRSFSLSAYRTAADDSFNQGQVPGQASGGQQEETYPIFVGNVPFAANSAWLRTLFRQFGEVDDARMVMSDGRSRGFGFVHFKTAEARESALRMDSREVEGRVLVVAESTSQRREPRSFDGPRPDAPRGAFLILDQISPTTRVSEIHRVLQNRGLPEPISSRMILDRRTGLGKGHAYFDFTSADEAEKVLRSIRDDPIFIGESQAAGEGQGEKRPLRAHYANPRQPSALHQAGRGIRGGDRQRDEGRRAYGDEFGGGQ